MLRSYVQLLEDLGSELGGHHIDQPAREPTAGVALRQVAQSAAILRLSDQITGHVRPGAVILPS